jgi:hypothetical protein
VADSARSAQASEGMVSPLRKETVEMAGKKPYELLDTLGRLRNIALQNKIILLNKCLRKPVLAYDFLVHGCR